MHCNSHNRLTIIYLRALIPGTAGNNDDFFAGQSRDTVIYGGAGILAVLACAATACCFRRKRKRADSDEEDFGPPPPPPRDSDLQARSSAPRMTMHRNSTNSARRSEERSVGKES